MFLVSCLFIHKCPLNMKNGGQMPRCVDYPYCSAVDCGSVLKWSISNQRPSFIAPPYTRVMLDDGSFSKEFYINSFGALCRYRTSEVKGDNPDSLKRSFARLRDLINCNFDSPDSFLFITLTYRDAPTLPLLSKQMRRFCASLSAVAPCRTIYVVEQQARGAWHVHLLAFFDVPAPWISPEWFDSNWQYAGHNRSFRGFYNVDRMTTQDALRNVGAYVCAYLTDSVGEHGAMKNARLMNYASGIHLYRCSLNVRRPVIYKDVPFSTYCDYADCNADSLIYAKQIDAPRDTFFRYEHFMQ